jgi:hypothetical protein
MSRVLDEVTWDAEARRRGIRLSYRAWRALAKCRLLGEIQPFRSCRKLPGLTPTGTLHRARWLPFASDSGC